MVAKAGGSPALSWVAAAFYEASPDGLRCTLCPHACVLADGEVGACRVRRRSGAIMQTATFSTTVQHLDPVERKPLYHYRPGTSALTLAPPGCSFACLYCENFRISQYDRPGGIDLEAEHVAPEALVEEARRRGASIALSYSEPSLAAELTLALTQAGRPRDVGVIWKTNGFVSTAALERLAPGLAAVNLDLKAADDARHHKLTGAPLRPVLEALATFLAAGVWVEISTPLIPRVNDDRDSLLRLAEVIGTHDPEIPWHLLRFTPAFRMSGLPPTHPDDLARARDLARDAGLAFVYVERALGPAARNTWCPGCGTEVVSRDVWHTREVSLVAGRCATCGREIPGRWLEDRG